MATTAILQPQDCLRRNTALTPPHRNPRRDRNNTLRIRRKKQISGDNNSHNNVESKRLVVPNVQSNNLVLGQVRILKRGEELDKAMKISTGVFTDRRFVGDEDLVLSSTDRLGPDPVTVMKDVRVTDVLYAGPASLLASPPPSSLPLPAFFSKERKNDVATTDLRRLLRLD